MVGLFRFFAEGFTLGLATGHICLATCGPIYTTFLLQKKRTLFREILAVLELSGGRFLTYLIVGALAGLFGRQVSELQRDYFSLAAYLLFSLYLLISANRNRKCDAGCAVGKWTRFAEWPFLLGMLTGINVCPSFLLAFTRSFTLSGPLAGMFFFAAFFTGTSIFIIPISFVGMLAYKRYFRLIAHYAAIGVAAWFIGNAGVIAYKLIKPAFDTRPVICLLDDQPLYIALSDPARTRFFAAEMAKNRSGPVFIADTISTQYDRYYVMTEAARLSDAKIGTPFRKCGVFVVVLGDNYISGADSIGTVITFLKNFHFRFDTKKGDLFYLR